MLDNPEKTTKLLAALRAAVPFEVELTKQLVKQLHMDEKHHTVSDLSYAGDEGGIVCHIVPPEKREALVVSLTHIRVPRSMPLAAAVVPRNWAELCDSVTDNFRVINPKEFWVMR